MEKGEDGRDTQIDGDLYLNVDGRGPDGTIIPLNSNIVVEPADRCPLPKTSPPLRREGLN